MRRSIRSLFATVLLAGVLAAAPTSAASQSVEEALSALARDNAELYVTPVAEGLGYSLHSGMAEDASVHSQLGFDFGVRVMGAWVPDEKKTFVPVLPDVTYEGTTYSGNDIFRAADGGDLITPSAAGVGNGVVLDPAGDYRDALIADGENPDDYQIPFPEGQDVSIVPFVVLQAGVGLGFNTEITARAIPSVEPSGDVGEVSAFGLGVKHEVGGWFPTPLPVDISLTAGYQDLSIGDYMDASSTAFGLLVGRGLGPLAAFATVENVHPSIDVNYTVDNPDLPIDGQQIAFSPDLGSETRFGVGVNMSFLLLNVSALYTLGDYNVASVKAGLSFR